MKTTIIPRFYIRSKGELWDYVRNSKGRPMSFETKEDAEIELTWRIQNDRSFKPATYEIFEQ